MDNPTDLKYAASHEWLRREDDGTATVGITHHAQDALGDLVYVELPEVGRRLEQGEACVVVESTKAASDVYAPLSGEVVEANAELADTPQKVNESPYEGGWLFKLKLSDPKQMGELLAADAYRKSAGGRATICAFSAARSSAAATSGRTKPRSRRCSARSASARSTS
jgi:glycine cleavage system H protein